MQLLRQRNIYHVNITILSAYKILLAVRTYQPISISRILIVLIIYSNLLIFIEITIIKISADILGK